MKNNLSKLFLFIFIAFVILQIEGKTYFKVSGKAVYNSKGVEGIFIYMHQKIDSKIISKKVKTDSNGNFFFYVQNGFCRIRFLSRRTYQKGFVARNEKIDLIIKDKNILNVIFFLEKECKISGFVKFVDNTPLQGTVHVMNDRGMWSDDIKSNGEYVITGIKADENTILDFCPDGVLPTRVENLILNKEGTVLHNINLIIPKKNSIFGKVIDKINNELIKDFIVIIRAIEEDEQFDAHKDENKTGEFAFYNLPNGIYYLGCIPVMIESPEGDIFYKPMEKKVTLNKNETKEVNFELERMTEVEIKEMYPSYFEATRKSKKKD